MESSATPPRPEMAQVDASAAQASAELQRTIATMNAAFDWTGPDDPDNPRNFSLARRIFSIVSVTLLAFVATLAGAIYAPAQDDVAADLGCSHEVAVLPLSLYNLGLAFGPLVGAPLSETYGRKAVFVLATPVFAAFTIGGGFCTTIASLTVCRFFAGMFAAPLVSNASAIIMDCTEGTGRGVSLGAYYVVPSFGAGFGPFIGGFIVMAKGWRWTQWTSVMLAAACYISVCFTRETYKKVVIQRRAIRLGLQDSSSQRTSPGRAFRYFATTLIQRPLHMLFTEPIVLLVSLYNGFLFGLTYTFVVAVPWIFRHYYDFSQTGETLSFLGLSCGTLLGSIPLLTIDFKFYQKRLLRWRRTHDEDDRFPPENRLVPAMLGSFILPVSLFVVAWTAHFRVHWMVPIVFQGGVMFGSLLVYVGANLFMLDAYGPLYGASASGAMMLTRYTFSAAFPLFALQMYKALGVGWATSLLGFVTVVMAPIPWCFWVYGERIRRRSRYETSA